MKARPHEKANPHERRDRIQRLGCIACARQAHHDRPALLYQVHARDPDSVIPLCHFHIHDWCGVRTNPKKFAYSCGDPHTLLEQVNAWLDYQDGILPEVSPMNPFTRNNICIYE